MPNHRKLHSNKPGFGCGFVDPKEFLDERPISEDESRGFQMVHVVHCIFCQNKIFDFITSNNTDPSSFDFTK